MIVIPQDNHGKAAPGLCAGGRLHWFANATKIDSYFDFRRPFSPRLLASSGCEETASDSAEGL